VLASSDLGARSPDITCSKVAGTRAVGLGRLAYKQVIRLLLELVEA
jgi:hypothetical protein